MPPEMIVFAKSYRRFLRLFSLWVACTPGRWRPAFIFAVGRWLNPFRFQRDKILRSIRLALPENLTDQTWRNWLDSHIQFALDFLNYKSLDNNWLTSEVTVAHPALLASLRESGGLLLTYHTHHQNTLCCALGLEGIKISAIAAPPEDSPIFSYIGRWAERMNTDSAQHFRGGTYIFTDNLRLLLHTTRKLFANRDVVLCLCDFHQPKAGIRSSAKLLGRFITPPTGAIEIAIKHGAPIYTAIFAPQNGKLVLKLKRLDDSSDSGEVATIIAGYFSFLESNLRNNPACWQGWEWFEDLPLANQVNP